MALSIRSHSFHVQLADLRSYPACDLPDRQRSRRGRYHLFVAVTGLALLGFVHFAPTGDQDSPIHDIYLAYESPIAGMFALMVLAALMTSVALLAIIAFMTLRRRTRE